MKTPHPIHGTSKGSLKHYENRRLDGGLNVLTDICNESNNVLDVGCGPGTITLDAAKLVPMGAVTGIDAEETSIEHAKQNAIERKVQNAEFLVADVYALPFDDGTFDVTYSNMLLEWIDEPIDAIHQMMRVTKPGGTVVARNNDYATVLFYPAMPAFEKWWSSLGYFRDHGEKNVHGSRWRGRELFTLFTRAGLHEVYVITDPPNPACYGTESFFRICQRIENHLDPAHPMGVFSTHLVDSGVLSEGEIGEAQNEFSSWRENPEAFSCWPTSFTAVGVVPR